MSIFGFFKGKKEEPQEPSYEDYLETVSGLLAYMTRNRDDDEYDDEYDDSEKED